MNELKRLLFLDSQSSDLTLKKKVIFIIENKKLRKRFLYL